ncbi:MAG: glycosyltransferase [Chloroflexi bacterium]|nr:glycosyltransferase [Chloroflexota bacterium]
MNIILFTKNYPSHNSPQRPFIERELPYLKKHFKKITIIPQKKMGEYLPLPKNVVLDNNFADYYKAQNKSDIFTKAISSKCFYEEIRLHPSILLAPQMLLRLIKFVGDAELTQSWTKNWIENTEIDITNSLFYSFWLTQTAFGLGLLKRNYPKIKVVSRAHGYDVFENRYTPAYIPCRTQTLKLINKTFLASADAHNYLKKNYPSFSQKYHTACLGVEPTNFTSKASPDKIFRIVSCSSIIPLKRVGLLAKAISHAAQIRPKQKFEWIHFGEGPNRKDVQKAINEFPSSIKAELYGFTPNTQILAHYKKNPVDIFVNLSTTEGTPVSIMEAISCGIPIIATKVGGNPEIVSEENGILLSEIPSEKEIVEAFFKIIDNPEVTLEKRKGSLNIWREKYNATKNFDKFAQQLLSVLKE